MPLVNSKEDVITIKHRGGASVDFMADCLTGVTDHPMLRSVVGKNFVVDADAVLQVTVLDCVFEKRTFNKATGPVAVAKFVLADGSSAVWKGVTSSNLSELVEYEMSKEAKESVPDVIEDAKTKGDLVFTVPCCLYDPKTNKGMVFNERATVAQLKQAHPCHVTWNKADFKKVFAEIPEDFDEDATVPMPCECETRFGLSTCAISSFPLCFMDFDQVFNSLKGKVSEDALEAEDFFDLSPPKKRWCAYTYFSLNVFHLRNRTRLPDCVVYAIRLKFRDEKDTESIGTKRKTPPKDYTSEKVAARKVNMELEEKKERDELPLVVDFEKEQRAVKEAFEKEGKLVAFKAFTEEVKSASKSDGDYWDHAIRIALEWKNRTKRIEDGDVYTI